MRNKLYTKYLVISLILLFVFILIYIIIYANKKNTNKGSKSYFYQTMVINGKVDDLDFIEYGEMELQNIDNYIQSYNKDILFCDFLLDQKSLLLYEINIKKENTIKKKLYLILLDKNKKSILYTPINYVTSYKNYCIKHGRLYKYYDFCYNNGISYDKDE